MSLGVWLKRGKQVNIGGRELTLMPLPLTRLFAIGQWLEENSQDVIKEIATSVEPGKIPHPLALVAKVLVRVDLSAVVLDIFTYPKDPDTGKSVNEGLDKAFFESYLDIPTAHDLFKKFSEINQLEELIKNLQSLPFMKRITEAANLAFGIPFLNSLQQSTDSTQSKSEGSHSHKSTDSSMHANLEKPETGNQEKKPTIQ